MNTLALVNQKGGCGKTTAAVNLAGALASKGQRVLVCDLDPQAHATMALGCAVEPGEPSLVDVLMDESADRSLVRSVIRAAPGGVALLPSSLELAEFEEVAERRLEPERTLRHVLAELADGYDFVLCDCPPRADGVLTANALRAADTVLLVVETGAFALQGALRAVTILEELAEDGETEFQLRVLGTLYDRRTRLARELLIGTQARFGALMYDTVIHQSVRLREAAAVGVPVQVLDPKSRAALDFDALAEEVLATRRDVLFPAAAPPLRAEESEDNAPGSESDESARGGVLSTPPAERGETWTD